MSTLALAGSLGRQPEELGGFDLKDINEFTDDFDANVGRAPLDLADVRAIYPGVMSKRFLGEAFLMPDTPKVGRE